MIKVLIGIGALMLLALVGVVVAVIVEQHQIENSMTPNAKRVRDDAEARVVALERNDLKAAMAGITISAHAQDEVTQRLQQLGAALVHLPTPRTHEFLGTSFQWTSRFDTTTAALAFSVHFPNSTCKATIKYFETTPGVYVAQGLSVTGPCFEGAQHARLLKSSR